MNPGFEKIPDFNLLPCPHCGERLKKESDHHGEYYEHPSNGCAHSFYQILNESHVKEWNTRCNDLPQAVLEPKADAGSE